MSIHGIIVENAHKILHFIAASAIGQLHSSRTDLAVFDELATGVADKAPPVLVVRKERHFAIVSVQKGSGLRVAVEVSRRNQEAIATIVMLLKLRTTWFAGHHLCCFRVNAVGGYNEISLDLLTRS